VLSGDVDTGDRVMVVLARADHRYQGLSAAEFLAAQGKSVLVVTNAHFAGDQWEETNRLEAYRRLARLGVEFTAMVELVAVRENEVELRSVYSLESQTLEVDSVVLSYGDQANNALLNELEGELTVPVLGAGDVVAPGDLQAAFRDGALASLDV
jgi:thioredoxin reductase